MTTTIQIPRDRVGFQAQELDKLRAEYAGVKTIQVEYLPQFRRLFDRCTDAALRQLATAKIRFVSTLARNAEIRRKEAL